MHSQLLPHSNQGILEWGLTEIIIIIDATYVNTFFLHRTKAAADVHRPPSPCTAYMHKLPQKACENPSSESWICHCHYTTAVWALWLWMYTARNYCVLLHHCRVSAGALNVASDVAWTWGRSILMDNTQYVHIILWKVVIGWRHFVPT